MYSAYIYMNYEKTEIIALSVEEVIPIETQLDLLTYLSNNRLLVIRHFIY